MAHASSLTENQACNFSSAIFRYLPIHNHKQLTFSFCNGYGCVGHRKQNLKKKNIYYFTFAGILYGYQLFVSEPVLFPVPSPA